MRTIETTALVGEDRKLTVQLPAEINPGHHHVVVVIEEDGAPPAQPAPLRFSAYPVGLAVDHFTFRREELYGDDGR
jgi:hypothetical protein